MRSALRTATRARHERLETRLSPQAICRSRRFYQAVLAAFYGFYAPLEVRLLRLALPLDMDARAKAPALREDLYNLGWTAKAVRALPRCRDLPDPRCVSQGLGSAYVLEGATLGGQILAREARARLGIDVDRGGRFFAGYGMATGALWMAFLETLEAAVPEEETEIAAHAARDTFSRLEKWLSDRDLLS